METRSLLEALREFERKDQKETCPVLEQYLCHIAQTGRPVLPWAQFKAYFMFKLEKVMDSFGASASPQRGQPQPNVDCVPFEQMKERILKIVDHFHGIPFTIQRLCELLTDPKRNYTGIDKFLLGLEKNVMVVSCISSTSEKHRTPSVNRITGVVFPSNCSLYSDSRNVTRPETQNVLNRPKISSCDSCSRNGFPDSPGNQKPLLIRDELKEHFIRDSSPSGGIKSTCGLKNRLMEADDAKQETKRLKFDENKETEHEDKDSSCRPSENQDASEGTSHQGNKPTMSEDQGSPLAGPSKENDISCETRLHSVESEASADGQEQPASPVTCSSPEHQNAESRCSGAGEEPPCDVQEPSASSSADSPTEGDTRKSDSTTAGKEPADKL